MEARVHEPADDRHVEIWEAPRPGHLQIRPFIPNDIPAVASIVREALRENYPTSLYLDIHRWWRDGFLVADLDGHPVGFLAAVISADGTARVLMFAVASGFRRHGIGTMLMDMFTKVCANRGLRRIELEVRKSNVDGMRFYNRYGFGIAYVLPSFYTDGEDGYRMIRDF
jgi:ribosomal-protein-alanine N-acetyltransferase